MGIVMGVAIDKGQTEGELELTVQMANPSGGASKSSKGKSSGGSESESESKSYINVSGTGKNTNYIIREMQHKMSRRIYVAHSEVIVISEDVARDGVRDSLDFFARAAEARMTVAVFVSKGKAKDILDKKPEFEKMPSVGLVKALKDQKITSHTPIVTEFEFLNKLVSKTSAAVLPVVSEIDDDGKSRIDISGCAVFKGSKMVGEMNEDECRGLLYVQNKVKTGVMLLTVSDVSATVEIRHAKTRVKPTLYTDGTCRFDVEVDATIGLGDQTGTFNLADPGNVGAMVGAAADAIKGEIIGAVGKSKEQNADVFGFGDSINRKYPDQWKKISKNWDTLYRNITVDVAVKAKADGSGRIDEPIAPVERA
jgi:spore germination protein KC